MDATPALELAELLAVDVSSLGLPERVEHQAAIERVRNKLDAVLLTHVAQFAKSGAWQEDAASSAINWFQGQIGGARDVMASRVKLGTTCWSCRARRRCSGKGRSPSPMPRC